MTVDTKIVLPPDFLGKELVIGEPRDFDAVRQQLRKEDERSRTFTAIPDLSAYLQRWGTKENTTVFCDQNTIVAILNEQEPLQKATFKVKWSTAFEQWRQALGNTFTQASFKEFVERRNPDIIDGIKLLNVVEDLKLTTVIEHDGKYDDQNNYQVVFKESTGGESAQKIPKHFEILIPISDGDAEPYRLQIELKLRKPKNSDEKFTFSLKCWELEDVLNESMNARIAQLKLLLEGWQIYAGTAA